VKAVYQDAFFVDVAGCIQAELNASREILSTVRRRCVNHASTGVHGDVVGHYANNFLVVKKRMAKLEIQKRAPWEAREFFRAREIALLDDRASELTGNDID